MVDEYGIPYKPEPVLPDFGWESKGAIAATILGMLVFHLASVFYLKLGLTIQSSEKLGYYLLPLWVAFFASIWKTNSRMTFLVGLIPAVLMFIACFSAVAMKEEGRINDWTYGFAGLMAGIVFGAWVVGRIVHMIVRTRLASG